MADSSRPKISSEHHERYAKIMETPVKSSPTSSSPTPKPKGLGNKLFIFTGKKKIIMEGTQKQEENVKTVNASPKNSSFDKKDEPKKEVKPQEQTVDKNEKTATKKVDQQAPKKLIMGGVVFIIIWTAAWAYFLGYFELIGL